jgi:hypothetical protein
MQSCPHCSETIGSIPLALTGLGLRAACRHCGSGFSVSRSWKHGLAALAVFAFAFAAVLSISQRTYWSFALLPVALAIGVGLAAHFASPVADPPRRSFAAWIGLVALFCAAAVAFSGLPH